MRTVFAFVFALFLSISSAFAQNIEGYIIEIQDGKVFVDLTSAQINVGDKLIVTEHGGYVTDPNTGRRVKAPEKQVATLNVTKTSNDYSIALPLDEIVLPNLKGGMKVVLQKRATVSNNFMENNSAQTTNNFNQSNGLARNNETVANDGKINIVIGDATVNDVVSRGHLGGYVADMLIEQVKLCPKVRLLDKNVLKENNANIYKPHYQLNIVMQKPDVVNEVNGAKVNVGSLGSGGGQFAQLKSVVNMSVSVIDLRTGEIVFNCAETGQSQARRINVRSELSVLGVNAGTEINGGIENYRHTLSGEAIQDASAKLGRTISQWFMGNISRSVVDNRVTESQQYMVEKMKVVGTHLYLGTQEIYPNNASYVFADNQNLYLQYKAGKKKIKRAWIPVTSLFLVGFAAEAIAPTEYCAIVGGTTVLGTLWTMGMRKSGKRTLRNVANQYNSYNSRYSEIETRYKKSDVQFAFTGNGFAINF